ncbi:nucleotidyltransferase family protein [Marinospirillum alkaliphilum]|uniref:CBS domain-containing protein n=1 Tax=Marinospirillum alkaliphilum DSM 21637 TaxID=1122209 RepID=A0A1K1VIG9_9GAMM|nr:nucleotidyltransferase family protein [Marinospirillum alkaliphilum]SFX24969.1 CBS domain-containing protein [Marinospirillum alkaliphilum DSM 21637]
MKNWQDTLVQPTASLEVAIEKLDLSAQQILLVTDEDKKLLGTVTDGDVRRALLKRLDLTTPIVQIMNRQPKMATADWSKARLLSFMEQQQLLQLPVVDADQRVTGLETLHGLLQKPRQDNPVFLMAGGFGKRLHPLTKTCPKPLLKVGDKPILELILESFVSSGFHRFYISTHYMPEKIREHFGDGSRWGVTITYIHEEVPLGTAGALGLLPHHEITLPLIMMNGDLLTTQNYLALLAFHEELGGSATVCVREYEYQIPYGVIESQENRATGIREKPVQTFNVNAGIYLLSPELVKSVPPDTHLDMPDLLQQEIQADRGVNIYSLKDYWLDIGRMDDFNQAQTDVSELFNG